MLYTLLVPIAPLTGLFDANSSGKTSILQVLLMLKQTVERPSNWNEAFYFGDEKSRVNLGNFDDRSSNLSVKLTFNNYARIQSNGKLSRTGKSRLECGG